MKRSNSQGKESLKSIQENLQILPEILVMIILYHIVLEHADRQIGFPAFSEPMCRLRYLGLYAVLLFLMFRSFECQKIGDLPIQELFTGQILALCAGNLLTWLQYRVFLKTDLPVRHLLILSFLEVLVVLVLVPINRRMYLKIHSPHRMLLVYGNVQDLILKIKMDRRPEKYRITDIISEGKGQKEIFRNIPGHDSVVLNGVSPELRNQIMIFCYRHGIAAYVSPDLTDIMLRGAISNKLFDVPLFLVEGAGLTPTQRVAKRLVDLAFCVLAMIPAAPIMLLVAVAIKLEDGGPVFYRQERMTKNRKKFNILKFRSMIVDAEKMDGAVLATGKDPRITRVGKFIRASRLDELPQLLNILKGDMSIVGPRPERPCFVEEYSRTVPEFDFRMKVKGGLTGYAQIFGKYNTSANDKLRLDLMYIENYSLLLDIRLILLTIRTLFRRESTEGIDIAAENLALAEKLLQEEEKKRKNP